MTESVQEKEGKKKLLAWGRKLSLVVVPSSQNENAMEILKLINYG